MSAVGALLFILLLLPFRPWEAMVMLLEVAVEVVVAPVAVEEVEVEAEVVEEGEGLVAPNLGYNNFVGRI